MHRTQKEVWLLLSGSGVRCPPPGLPALAPGEQQVAAAVPALRLPASPEELDPFQPGGCVEQSAQTRLSGNRRWGFTPPNPGALRAS